MVNKLIKIGRHPKSLVLVDQAVISGGSFVFTLLMARAINPYDFGVYSAIVLMIYFVLNVLNAIVIQPLQVSLARVTDQRGYLTFNFCLQLFALAVLVAVYLLVQLFFPTLMLSLKGGTGGIVLLLVGYGLHHFFRKCFLALNEVLSALLVDSIAVFFQVALVFLVLVAGTYSLNEIILLAGLAYLPALIVGLYYLRPSVVCFRSWGVYLRMHIKQGKWLLLTALTQWWSGNLFVVASGLYLGVAALGAFRLVQTLFGVLNILFQTFENYVLPQATSLWMQSQDKAKDYLRRISLQAAMLVVVLLGLLYSFSDTVMYVAAGTTYLDYAFVIKGMSCLYLLIFIGYPVRLAIRMLMLNRSFFVGYLLSLCFSLLSYQYLLEQWGLVGAIGGLMISQVIVLLYWQYELHKNEFILWK